MEKSFQTGSIDLTLGEIAQMLGGELEGPPEFRVGRLASAETPDPAGLAFAEKKRYVEQAKASGVGALLIGPGLDSDGIPAIRVPNPRMAFFMLLNHANRPYAAPAGVHPTAVIDPTADVHPEASIGPYVVIGPNTAIERGAKLLAFAYVGDYCVVRQDAMIHPHAVLLRNVEVGARSVIFPGVVLGSEGFGFVWDGAKQVKVPQVGRVVIGPDCEVGALSAIDRATSGVTTIGAGTKIDNLVQIAHNVHVGEHGVIAAAVAIAGSSSVGDRATIAGQAAIGDHISVCDDVTLGGRAGVTSNITEPGAYFDFPAQPVAIARRNMVLRGKLHELVERIRTLEEKLAKLEGEPQ